MKNLSMKTIGLIQVFDTYVLEQEFLILNF